MGTIPAGGGILGLAMAAAQQNAQVAAAAAQMLASGGMPQPQQQQQERPPQQHSPNPGAVKPPQPENPVSPSLKQIHYWVVAY